MAEFRLLEEELAESVVEASEKTIEKEALLISDVLGEDVRAELEGNRITLSTTDKILFDGSIDEFNGYRKQLGEGTVSPSDQLKRLGGEPFAERLSIDPKLRQAMNELDNNFYLQRGEQVSESSKAIPKSLTTEERKIISNNYTQTTDNLTPQDKSIFNSGSNPALNAEESLQDATRLSPEAQEEFINFVENNPDVKKLYEDMRKGKLEKLGLFVTEDIPEFIKNNYGKIAVGIAAAFLVMTIKKHQNAVNGCWFIDKNGNKVKVSDFTCSDSDKSISESGNIINSSQIGAIKGDCDTCASNYSGQCNSCCNCSLQTSACKDGTFVCINKDFGDSVTDIVDGVEGVTNKVANLAIKGVIIVVVIIVILFIIWQLLQLFILSKVKKSIKRK